MHDLMIEPTKKYADIILQSTYNEIILKMIVSYIESNIWLDNIVSQLEANSRRIIAVTMLDY